MLRIRHFLFGIRPSLLAWWSLFLLLAAAAVGGVLLARLALSHGHLASSASEAGTITAEVLYRTLLVAVLTKGYLVVVRQPYVPTTFRAQLTTARNLYVLSAMCTVFTLLITFQLKAGPLGFWLVGLLPLGVTMGLAVLSERILQPFYQDTAYWKRVYEVTHQPMPDWLSELRAELERKPGYRSSH